MKTSLIILLRLLREHNLFPTLINDNEESLLFEFFMPDEKFFLVEIYDTGEIVFLSRQNKTKVVEEISPQQLREKIAEIKSAQI